MKEFVRTVLLGNTMHDDMSVLFCSPSQKRVRDKKPGQKPVRIPCALLTCNGTIPDQSVRCS